MGDVCQPQGLLRETSKPAAELGFTQSVSLGCGTPASGHGKVKAGGLDTHPCWHHSCETGSGGVRLGAGQARAASCLMGSLERKGMTAQGE